MATFVFVHGGWDGGWSWSKVEKLLRPAGHEVFRPTLTGSGERVHLASPDVNLDTHIMDVVNVLVYEDLHDAIVVGVSYGGMVITGVADRVPERIAQLVYLDAYLPQNGQSAVDLIGPEMLAAVEAIANAVGDGWRVPHDPPDAYNRTDFTLNAGKQRITLGNPAAASIKRTFICCTERDKTGIMAPIEKAAARAREEGWDYYELATKHWPVWDQPDVVADLLLRLA
jgi:pimeloyl-ACP methyl ester carboxylesterase